MLSCVVSIETRFPLLHILVQPVLQEAMASLLPVRSFIHSFRGKTLLPHIQSLTVLGVSPCPQGVDKCAFNMYHTYASRRLHVSASPSVYGIRGICSIWAGFDFRLSYPRTAPSFALLDLLTATVKTFATLANYAHRVGESTWIHPSFHFIPHGRPPVGHATRIIAVALRYL